MDNMIINDNPNADMHSLELEVSLLKLTNHLKNDKKFSRAILILTVMIKESLNISNNILFYNCIIEFISESERNVLDKKFRSFYIDLFDVIHENIEIFTIRQRYRLLTFSLYCSTRNKLLTDDSFSFAQQVKNVKTFAEDDLTYFTNPHDNESLSDRTNIETREEICVISKDELLERQKVLILTLQTCSQKYNFSWAKQPIEQLVKVCSERRSLIDAELVNELDVITEHVLLTKRKEESNTSVTLVNRTQNVFTHPLFTKKTKL